MGWMQAVILVALASLPVAVLIDSTVRRGRPAILWAIGMCLPYAVGISQAMRLMPISGSDSFEVAGLLGSLAGIWMPLFLLYRGATARKPAEKQAPAQPAPLRPLHPGPSSAPMRGALPRRCRVGRWPTRCRRQHRGRPA